MKYTSPYPSHVEIIRAIAVALGTKKPLAGKLDYIIKNQVAVSPDDIAFLLQKVISEPLKKGVAPLTAELLSQLVTAYLIDYTQLLCDENADGLTRDQTVLLLSNHVLPEFWNSLLFHVHDHFSVPLETLNRMCSLDVSALQVASEWIGTKFPGGETSWKEYTQRTQNNDTGNSGLYTFHLGKNENHSHQNLPNQQSLYRLFTSPSSMGETMRGQALSVLTLARVLDYVKRTSIIKDSVPLAFSPSCVETNTIFSDFRRQLQQSRQTEELELNKLYETYTKLDAALSPNTIKDGDTPAQCRTLLAKARAQHKLVSSEQRPLADRSHFYQARFHVLSGALLPAVEEYELALSEALYRDGPLLPRIIQEGYCVAARYGKGTHVLLKKLKMAATMFGIDGASVHDRKTFANKGDDHLTQWERSHWKAKFQTNFKTECMFPEFNLPTLEIKPWFLNSHGSTKNKIDPRYPNAKKTSGETISTTTPQISLCIRERNFIIFQKLLDKGADINVIDDFGSTPLISALSLLNPMNSTFNKNDIEFINALQELPHTYETLNSYDQSSLSTALSCAIDTGELKYVDLILSMANKTVNANTSEPLMAELVNKIILVHRFAPIFYILQLIAGVKHRDKLQHFQQASHIYDLEQLRGMAKLLLTNAADPNLRFISHGPTNYGPFWLAIQLDEAELLTAMLSAGADSATPLVSLNSKSVFSPLQYATANGASECASLLKK